MRKYVRSLLLSTKRIDHWIFGLLLFFRNKLTGSRFWLAKIKNILDCEAFVIQDLKPASVFNSYGPKRIDQEPKVCEVTIPKLSLYKIEKSCINSRVTAFILNKKVFFEKRRPEVNIANGHVYFHGQKKAMVRNYPVEEIEEGFFLAGSGSWNWYHWMIEILPKLLLHESIPTNTLLVSDVVLRTPSMSETLDILLSKTNKEVKFLKDEVNYKVNNLYHFNEVTNIHFNILDGGTHRVDECFMRVDILKAFRNTLLEQMKLQKDTPKKIYLRRLSYRVPHNQSKLEKQLEEMGFVTLDFGNLSLTEQVSHMHNADFIIGITGAAFTNIMFAQPKTNVLCFMPNSYQELSCFSNLAHIFEVNLVYDFYALEKQEKHQSNKFELNIEKVIELYQKMENGYA